MPFSNLEQLSPILQEIRQMKPKSILDVGCGLGVYGFLSRIYLELYGDDQNFFKKLQRRLPWDITIDAIEGFKDYLDFIPKWAYNELIMEPAMEAFHQIPNKTYDLVLALAILEHFTKEEGIAFLNELRRVGKSIIISVPKEWSAQVVPENELETHRSHWTGDELLSWGFNRLVPHPFVWIAILDQQDTQHDSQEISLLSKQAVFRNSPFRYLYKLQEILPRRTETDAVIERMEDDSLRYFYIRYENTRLEKWALRRRIGRQLLALAVVSTKGNALFIHDLCYRGAYLTQLLQKLENLAAKKGLKTISVLPKKHGDTLLARGYAPAHSTISQVLGR